MPQSSRALVQGPPQPDLKPTNGKPTAGNPWVGVGPLLKLGERGESRPLAARDEARRRHLDEAGPVDVSVCIVNWNARDLLRQCLISLHDHAQGVRLETIVVDNASRDGAADMVEEEFPEVLLIRNEANAGFSRANNQAVRRARGRYVLFLNNDTVVPPEMLRPLVDYMEKHPNVGMVGPRLRGVDGEIQISCRPRPTVSTFLHHTFLFRWLGLGRRAYHAYRRRDFDPNATRAVDVLMGAAVMLERERLLAWGGWDEDFTFGGEDLELSYRVNRHARVVYCPQAEIIHYGRVSTRTHASYSAPNIAVGFLKYLRKTGAGRVRLFLYKLATTLDAPVQGTIKGLQSVVRYLCGRKASAMQSALAARAYWHFLRRALIPFWRA